LNPRPADDRLDPWHALAMSLSGLSLSMVLLAAGCTISSGPGPNDGAEVVADGVHYRILSSGRIVGQGWQGYAVKYNWHGAVDAPTLQANADHLLSVFGPEARKGGDKTLIVMAVFPGRSLQVNLGYELAGGAWKELKKSDP
jgi:hypothetical protein